MNKFIISLPDIEKDESKIVGPIAADFAEMIHAGMPVPDGFVVTTNTYFSFLHQNNLLKKIHDLLETATFDRPESLEQISGHIKKMIFSGSFSDDLVSQIYQHYTKLAGSISDSPVTLSANHSYFHSISGESNLIQKIKGCWALHFTPQALQERAQRKIDHFKDGVAVVVQKKLTTEVSGVILTANPLNNDGSKIIIEVNSVNEHHEVWKKNLEIYTQVFSSKKSQLKDTQIIELATYAKKLEKYFYFTQEIYWALVKNKIFILRHKVLHSQVKQADNFSAAMTKFPLFAKGIGVSAGIAQGSVRIIKTVSDAKKITHGDVIVAPEVTSSYHSALKKAAAILTEQTGRTSYPALLARELEIPGIVGLAGITTKLHAGQLVLVNGGNGEIYSSAQGLQSKTATRVFAAINTLEATEKITAAVDGILLNTPELILDKKGLQSVVAFCNLHKPIKIIYKLSDFSPEQSNRLGFRGAYRQLRQVEAFKTELAALKKLQELAEIKTLTIMLPFVRTSQELFSLKEVLKNERFDRGANYKLLLTIATPANVINLDALISQGIDGVCIDLDELTALYTGVDERLGEVAHIFDPLDPAVLWALDKIIATANKHGLTSSIYGTSLMHHPALIEKLVTWGIGSIAVTTDYVEALNAHLVTAERNLIQGKST